MILLPDTNDYCFAENYTQVHEYVAKAEHSTVAGDVSFPLKLKVAAGTAFLAQGSFYDASQQFGFVYSEGQDLGLPLEDIALYGALCSMAFSERSKLQTLVDSPGYLDLVPALQEALQLYCRAHLPSSFKTLKHYYPALERDMILAPKLKELFECIIQRFCMEYLKPYRRVDLNQMAELFEMPVDRLIVIVAELIGSGKITASRIDWTNRILERLSTESILYRRQQATQQKLKYMEQNILNNAYGLMVRVACMENAPDQSFNAMDYSDDDSTDHLNSRASGRNPEDF
jgi:26S proteasome subunit RPN7/PCI domain